MFCQNCGNKITGNEAFCPYCGQKINQETVGAHSDFIKEDSEEKTKMNWKEFATLENIERFAPVATVAPVVLALVVRVICAILFMIFGPISVIRTILTVIAILFELIFGLATLAATIGLVYVAIKKRNLNVVWTWIPPVSTFFAFVACICIAFKWNIPAWIFGMCALILGYELIARITILAQPMDTPFNMVEAFEIYKQYYRLYKEKYPSKKSDVESNNRFLAPTAEVSNSYFDGAGIELFGYYILGALLILITCGIATPWVICMINKWKLGHTYINGRKLTFDGTGASLLGHWILWEILSIITCGIYGFFAYVAVKKWEVKHTFIEGEPIIPGEAASYFDGNSFEFFGYALLGALLVGITCGIAFPWVMCMIKNWEIKHTVINGNRMRFSGTGLAFLGEYIIIALLTAITCSIYSPWGSVRMFKYITKHTDFEN